MLTVNVALDAPDGTVIVAGTVPKAVLDVLSVTVMPAPGAAPVSCTVPVDGDPPATVIGERVSDFTPSDIGVTAENSLVLPSGAVAVDETKPAESGTVAENVAAPELSVVTVCVPK